jgi:hypothetical protein
MLGRAVNSRFLTRRYAAVRNDSSRRLGGLIGVVAIVSEKRISKSKTAPFPNSAKDAAPLLFGGLAEVEADVEFFFEEVGAAGGVAQVFGGVAAGFYLEADGAALK